MGEDRIEPEHASREQDARMPIARSARDRVRDQARREQQLAARVLLAEERLEAERRRRADAISALDRAVERRTVDVADALIAYVDSAGLGLARAAIILDRPQAELARLLRQRRADLRATPSRPRSA